MRRAFYRAYFWQTINNWKLPLVRNFIHRRWERAFIAFARARGDQFFD